MIGLYTEREVKKALDILASVATDDKTSILKEMNSLPKGLYNLVYASMKQMMIKLLIKNL